MEIKHWTEWKEKKMQIVQQDVAICVNDWEWQRYDI